MSTTESLHKQCRTLESLFDNKLTAYGRLAATITRPGSHDLESSGSLERWQDLEVELEELLQKLGEINDELDTPPNDASAQTTQTMLRAIQRHRDVHQDNIGEFRRTKASVKHALDQMNLLSGVRNDIDAHKSSAADMLLAERGRIDSSHQMTDEVLEQAYETRADFSRQRATITGINSRMSGVLSTMPGINNLLGMIKSRRRRDSIIVGCLIGVCLILLLSYITK